MESIESDHEHCSRCGCKLEFRNTIESPTTGSLVDFFGAKIAATFMQLNAKCAHGPYRCVMPGV